MDVLIAAQREETPRGPANPVFRIQHLVVYVAYVLLTKNK